MTWGQGAVFCTGPTWGGKRRTGYFFRPRGGACHLYQASTPSIACREAVGQGVQIFRAEGPFLDVYRSLQLTRDARGHPAILICFHSVLLPPPHALLRNRESSASAGICQKKKKLDALTEPILCV